MVSKMKVRPDAIDVCSFPSESQDFMFELRRQFYAIHVKLDAILRQDVAHLRAQVDSDITDDDIQEERREEDVDLGDRGPESVFSWRGEESWTKEHNGRSRHLKDAHPAHDGDTPPDSEILSSLGEEDAEDRDNDNGEDDEKKERIVPGDSQSPSTAGDRSSGLKAVQLKLGNDQAVQLEFGDDKAIPNKSSSSLLLTSMQTNSGIIKNRHRPRAVATESIVTDAKTTTSTGKRSPERKVTRTRSGPQSLRSFQTLRSKRPEDDGASALEGVWMSQAQEKTLRQKTNKLTPVQDMVSKRAKRGDRQPGFIYELVMGSVIVLNAVYFGVQAEMSKAAVQRTEWINYVFFGIFSADVVFRFVYSKKMFFQGIEKWWNVFDVFAVGMMAFELLFSALHVASLLRAARLVRFVRFARLIRFARDCRELFFLLHIFRRFTMWRLLAWVIFLSCVICYIGAVILTQGAYDTCENAPAGPDENPVCVRFGSLARSMLSLLQSMYGGALWGDVYTILESVGEFYAIIFLCFIAFSVVLVHPLLTAAVLKGVNDCSKLEIDMVVQDALHENTFEVQQLVHVFGLIDTNNSGAVSLDNWKGAFKQQQVAVLLSKFGIHKSDLPQVFALMDGNRHGSLDIFDFVHGCMMLRHDGTLLRLRSWMAAIFDHEVGVFSTGASNSPQREGVAGHFSSDGEFSTVPSLRRGSLRPMESLESSFASRMMNGPMSYAVSGQNSDDDECSQDVLDRLRDRLHTQKPILKVEQRAMSLEELIGIREHLLQDKFWMNEWIDYTGKKIPPKEVNLYHLSSCFMAPMCAPHGVVLKGLRVANPPNVGVPVIQKDPHQSVPSASGELIEIGDSYITVRVTHGFFKDSSWCEFPILLDGEPCGVPSEVKAPGCISYKELITSVPMSPLWFCSHWWGEQIFDFVSGCEEHARLRSLPEDRASYWVCAYANRQYDLTESITDDPEQSSFRKAMLLSLGALLHLDSQATPFSRIWCDYELIKTLMDKRKKMDIVTVSRKSNVTVLVDGQLPSESQVDKNRREQHFPITIVAVGLVAQLQDGACSVQRDKDVILLSVRKDAIKKKINPDEAFDIANNILHTRLARAVWPQAIKRGMVHLLDLPRVLAKGGDDVLEMSFAALTELRDKDLTDLADGFAPGVTTIHLSFEGCNRIRDSGVAAISKGIPPSVKSLWLDFVGCHSITDKGIESLARSVPDSLQELRLDLAMCTSLSLGCVEALSKHLPRSISMLGIDLTGTKVDRIFTSRSELMTEIRKHGGSGGIDWNVMRSSGRNSTWSQVPTRTLGELWRKASSASE